VIKLLLVEDDPDMLDLTAYVLRRERFVVVEAADGAQAIRRWQTDRPDLVILDLGLPNLDGFEVMRRIRQEQETPILVVTGRTGAQDIMRAFNLGTDDFIPKPYEFRELIARVRAILRRSKGASQEPAEPQVQCDGLTLDPQTYEVSWRDTCIRLTPTEFRILYLLATNAGRVVPASRMYTYVWGSQGGDANALRSHISHLRRKLSPDNGDNAEDAPGTISSVPAVGYVFRRTGATASPRPATPVPAVLPAPATTIGGPTPPSAPLMRAGAPAASN
jgi:two-component system, OmpR family, response regulator